VPPEKAESLVANLGPSMLYGAMRELIMLITSRGPNPVVVLPAFSFIKENVESMQRYDTPEPSNRISSHLAEKK
jgi:hypothetical protein